MPLWIENKPLAETSAGERCTDGAFGASALALGALPPSAREVLVSLFSAYSLHQEWTQRAVFVSVFARGCQLHELVSEEEHGHSTVAGTKSWSAHGLLPGISSRKRCIRQMPDTIQRSHEVLFETIMREVTTTTDEIRSQERGWGRRDVFFLSNICRQLQLHLVEIR